MKGGLPAFPTGEKEIISGLSPHLRPVREDSPLQEAVGLEALSEAVAQEADVSVAAKNIAS
jgi:hypothetical protein